MNTFAKVIVRHSGRNGTHRHQVGEYEHQMRRRIGVRLLESVKNFNSGTPQGGKMAYTGKESIGSFDSLAKQAALCGYGKAQFIGEFTGKQPEPQTERQIPHQLNQLEKAICGIEQYFSDLQNKISPVIRKEVIGKQEENKEPSLCCDLAEHLRIQVKRLNNIGEAIIYTIKSIEL